MHSLIEMGKGQCTIKIERHSRVKNIAFKCTYNDGGIRENGIGFIGTCSDHMTKQNVKAKRVWCSNLGCPCRKYIDGKISRIDREQFMIAVHMYAMKEECSSTGKLRQAPTILMSIRKVPDYL